MGYRNLICTLKLWPNVDLEMTRSILLLTTHCVLEIEMGFPARQSQCGVSAVRAILRRRWRVLCALLALGSILAVRLPTSASLAVNFPQHTPTAVAHFLADFSNYQHLDNTIGTWWIEEESGNFTWWEYAARYECGARCYGRAVLRARAEHKTGEPQHGVDSLDHRLHLHDTRCLSLPLMPWPILCEDIVTDMLVSERQGGGARVVEETSAGCGVLAALTSGCDLRTARETRARRLKTALL